MKPSKRNCPQLMFATFLCSVFAANASAVLPPGVIVVDLDATTGNNNGTAWEDAYVDLQDAFIFAKNPLNSVSQIWVAEGTYLPDAADPGNQVLFFDLTDLDPNDTGLMILSGFNGTEEEAEDRRIHANIAILCGDLNGDDTANFGNRTDNSYHVISGSGVKDTVIIDGFTITGGYANGGSADQKLGGGVYITGTNSNVLGPRFESCIIIDNFAATSGGGLHAKDIALNLRRCTVKQNKSIQGGGIWADGAILRSCVIEDNIADDCATADVAAFTKCIYINCVVDGMLRHTPASILNRSPFMNVRMNARLSPGHDVMAR